MAADASVRALTVHYSMAIDAAATGRTGLALRQDLRAERRGVAQADRTIALSDRVMTAIGAAAHAPAALHMPSTVPPLPDAPRAGILADWHWAPNRIALDRVLAVWPDVRRRVPSARLLLAGRGDPSVGTLPGVEVRGPVERAEDFLAGVAVVVFPCPDTSGPKIKSLEALAHGRALVTTTAGLEGLHLTNGAAVVAGDASLADDLARLLGAPEEAAAMGHRAHQAVRRRHAPEPAAAARLDAVLVASRAAPPRGTGSTPER